MGDKKIIIPAGIREEIRNRCAPIGSGRDFRLGDLYSQLAQWAEKNLKLDIAKAWNKRFQGEGISLDTLGDAVLDTLSEDSGAVIDLANLLCNYASLGNFVDALKAEGTTIEKEISETKRIKKEIKDKQLQNVSEDADLTPFGSSSNSFNILILPFYNSENNIVTNLGNVLKRRLKLKGAEIRNALHVKYHLVNSYELSDHEIKMIGEKSNADMVIWGVDSQKGDTSNHHIYFNYISFKSTDFDIIGKTKKLNVERLIEIGEGASQFEIDQTVFVIWANKCLKNSDYKTALAVYELIKLNRIDLELLFRKTYCHLHLEQIEEAFDSIEEILKVSSKRDDPQKFFSPYLERAIKSTSIPLQLISITIGWFSELNKVHSKFASFVHDNFQDNAELIKVHSKKALEFDPDDKKAHLLLKAI